jgi:uncharacterized protein YraI
LGGFPLKSRSRPASSQIDLPVLRPVHEREDHDEQQEKEHDMHTIKKLLLGASLVALSAGAAAAAPAVVESGLNLRSGPGTGYAVVATMPAGARVDARDCSGSWCRVSYDGTAGYASRAYLDIETAGVAPQYSYYSGYYAEPYYYEPGYAYTYSYPEVFGFSHGHHFHHRRFRHEHGRSYELGQHHRFGIGGGRHARAGNHRFGMRGEHHALGGHRAFGGNHMHASGHARMGGGAPHVATHASAPAGNRAAFAGAHAGGMTGMGGRMGGGRTGGGHPGGGGGAHRH